MACLDAAAPLPRPAPGAWPRLRDLLALHGQRRALAGLDDRMLADIGLTRAQAQAEAGRPVWDAPRHWRG
jgi:uncharacterized protein YjiS (DUF1127 family)